MARKINSEFIVKNDKFKIKVGTTDKKNPKTIYIECGFFIEPKVEKEDYSEDIKYIEAETKELARKVSNATNPGPENIGRLFEKDFIFIFEIAESRVFYGKKSYVSFQIHLKQKGAINFNLISSYTETLSKYIITVLLNRIKDVGFEVTKTKK